VFLITAGTFGAMKPYGYTTRKHLTHVGSFMFMGLIGVVIASPVDMFIASTALQLTISVIGVIVSVGLTARDTQCNKPRSRQADGTVVAGKQAIMGALALDLDLPNLFPVPMQLLGGRRRQGTTARYGICEPARQG
jgi:FtsH-binding integral membrane protein